jgi:hypothetical protein
MLRCCQTRERISIQDIVAFPDEKVDSFFEEFEREVDISHNKTLSKEFIKTLYTERNIKIKKAFEIEVDLNLQDYLGHARQSEKSKSRVSELLEKGLNNPDISKYFFARDQNLFFKREVLGILGEK